jgi:hypothetical protein
MGVEKRCVMRVGKKYNFQKGGINSVFGPKYRPLEESVRHGTSCNVTIKLAFSSPGELL